MHVMNYEDLFNQQAIQYARYRPLPGRIIYLAGSDCSRSEFAWDCATGNGQTAYGPAKLFPFEELPAPAFQMEADWSLEGVVGMLSSWSAVPKYMAARGSNPLSEIAGDLETVWGDPRQSRHIRWKLFMRVGRV